jgi:hypothetical protein
VEEVEAHRDIEGIAKLVDSALLLVGGYHSVSQTPPGGIC